MPKILIEVDTDSGAVRVVSGSAPVDESWRDETGFPKIKEFGRARFMLVAPVNPAWRPSMEAEVIGAAPAHLGDPGDPDGARSPAGFPTVAGRIIYGQGTFASDAELEAYIGAAALSQANMAAGDVARSQEQAALQPGAIDIATLTKDDLKFFWTFGMELLSYVGPVKVIHDFNAWMDYGRRDDGTGHVPAVPGIPGTVGWTVQEHQQARDGWAWGDYTGPLRAVVAKHRGVASL